MAPSTSNSGRRSKQLDIPRWALTLSATVLLFLGLAVVFVTYRHAPSADFLYPLGVMALNIAITVLLIDALEKQRFRLLEKHDLTKQMASAANHFATEAVNRLRQRGWLTDGSLDGEVFANADLEHVQLEGARLRKVDLSNSVLTQITLAGADLSEATLFGANLTGTSLSDVRLDKAKLCDPDHLGIVMPDSLEGAKMRSVLAVRINLNKRTLGRSVLSGNFSQAKFQHCDMDQADLSTANLDRADFRYACLTHAKFDGATMSRAKLPTDGEQLAGASFHKADLSDVDLSKAILADVHTFASAKLTRTSMPASLCGLDFSGATFTKVDLTDRDLSKACFKNATLNGVCIRGANLSGADFEGADLRGADLSDSTVDGDTSFKHANLEGKKTKLPATLGLTDLEGANLSGTDLSGCDLSRGRLSHGHFDGTTLPDEAARLEHMDLSSAKDNRELICPNGRCWA